MSGTSVDTGGSANGQADDAALINGIIRIWNKHWNLVCVLIMITMMMIIVLVAVFFNYNAILKNEK